MTDEATNGAAPQQQQPELKILGQYIRDLSFENVAAQKGAQNDGQPDIQVQVNLDARKRSADNQYEVITTLKITAKAKGGDDMIFALELQYSGVFHIVNVPEEQMHPFLLIECPRQTFPFIRRIVSDVTRDGGYPPLNLDLIDFVALYRQELSRRAEAQKASEQTTDA